MDFVVLGFGLGALAVLIGLGVRDLGPLGRRVPRRGDLAWSEVASRVRWGRGCRAVGLLATLGGALVCLLTLIALMLGLSDGAGMTLVVLTLVAAALAVGAWFLLDRFRPSFGAGRAVGRLGGALGDVRRRPAAPSASQGPARRAPRRPAPPPVDPRSSREPAAPARRAATATPAGAARPDSWMRSAAEAGYLDADDPSDVAGRPVGSSSERSAPPPPRADRGR